MSSSSTDYSPARGGRRRSSNRGGHRRPRRESLPPTPVKRSLWDRIVGFFKSPANQPSSALAKDSSHRTRVKTARPPQAASQKPSFRKPELVEVTSSRVYVGNLSFDATESDLYELFKGAGFVQNVEVVCHRDSQRSKGFGFVQMQTIEEAKRAVADLHDQAFMGRKLVVSGAKAPPEGRESRNGRPKQAE